MAYANRFAEHEATITELRRELREKEREIAAAAEETGSVVRELQRLQTVIKQSTEIQQGRRRSFPSYYGNPDRVAFSVQEMIEDLEGVRPQNPPIIRGGVSRSNDR